MTKVIMIVATLAFTVGCKHSLPKTNSITEPTTSSGY